MNTISKKRSRFAPISDLKKIRARWDAQVARALKSKKYPDAASALRGF